MKTLRYNADYLIKTVYFLQNEPNMVQLSADIFFDVARQFENGEPDAAKLNKLFSKAYTMLAVDNDELVGVASMDKDGMIGILAVCEKNRAKICAKLLGALENRAVKRDMPYLFAVQTEQSKPIFISNGYAPFDINDEGGDETNNQYAKKIKLNEKIDLKPEGVKEFNLNPHKKITVEGKFSLFPAVFLGTASFFMMLLAIFTISAYKSGELDSKYKTFAIVFGLLFAVALAIFIGYLVRGRKLKNEVLSMRITNGVIVSLTEDKTWHDARNQRPDYTRISITYVFYDENMQRREGRFSHKYQTEGPYFYEGQELVVACSADKSYILHAYTIDNLQYDGANDKDILEYAETSDNVQENELAEYVPLKAVKLYYACALSFFIALAILVATMSIFSIFMSNQTGRAYLEELWGLLKFIAPIELVLLAFAVYFVAVPVCAKRKYNSLLQRRLDVKLTDGKLVFGDKTYKADNKMRFYCVYKDGTETKRVRVPRWIVGRMVKTQNTSVKVLFDGSTVVVLVRRDIYPDVFPIKLR